MGLLLRFSFLPFRHRSLWRKAPFSPEENLRTERWLATARLFLASSSLVALWLERGAGGQVPSGWALLLGLYFAHSAAIVFLLRSPQQSTPGFRVLVHSVDLLLPALLSPFPIDQSNPFFLFFVFVLAAAAYRWGLRETVMTAVASMSLLILDAVASHQHIDKKRLFMESVYLIVMSLLLGYLAERQKKLRAERDIAARMLGLVRMESGLSGTLVQILGELARLYGANGAVVATRESGSHRVVVGRLDLSKSVPELEWVDTGPSAAESYLGESAAASWYAAKTAENGRFTITGLTAEGRVLYRADQTSVRRFSQSHEFEKLAGVSFSFSHELSGRIFLFDPDFASSIVEELRFLQDLARQIAPAIYNLYLLRRLRSRAGAVERARLVRELHDGAVQSLIGVEMQVDVLRRHSPAADVVTSELERIQGLLREEVLKLRELMQEMKSTEVDARRLPGFLRDTVQRFQRETGITAQFIMDADEVVLPQAVCRELARIAQEALVNVRKHSQARRVLVRLVQQQEDESWQLVIEDDGAGFPFSGRITQAEMDSNGGAPGVIRERVRLIQGELTIESKPGEGSRVEIRVPQLQAAEVGSNAQYSLR